MDDDEWKLETLLLIPTATTAVIAGTRPMAGQVFCPVDAGI